MAQDASTIDAVSNVKLKGGRKPNDFIRSFFNFDADKNVSICHIGSCKFPMKGRHAPNLERHVMRHHALEAQQITAHKVNCAKNIAESKDVPKDSPGNNKKKRKAETMIISMTAKRLKEACCDLVTVNGRPFSFLEDSGFRKIIDPIIDSINQYKSADEDTVSINRQNIKKDIKERAEKLREEIQNEVKGRMVCLKIDSATRLGRSVMGLNIQFAKEGKIVLRNLCTKELLESHTAENFRNEINLTLQDFNIQSCNVYSATSDNGANMVKAISLLNSESENNAHRLVIVNECDCTHVDVTSEAITGDADEAEDSFHQVEGTSEKDPSSVSLPTEKDDSETDSDDLVSESETSDADASSSDETDPDNPSETEFGQASSARGRISSKESVNPRCADCQLLKEVLRDLGVVTVRCAAHTLQLSVADALKLYRELTSLINRARNLCKYLRTPSITSLLKALGYNKPKLDVLTRWHSTYDMLKSLLDLKNACAEIAQQLSERENKGKRRKTAAANTRQKRKIVNLSERDWKLVEEFCKSLEPAKIATKRLQSEQLTVGDFYHVWMTCKLETAKLNLRLARDLVAAMSAREKVLLGNNAFSAAIYMDPRFRVVLNAEPERKATAKAHLQALWLRLKSLSELNETTASSQSASLSPESSETSADVNDDLIEGDPMDAFLNSLEEDTNSPSESVNIKKLLECYEKGPRLSKDQSVLTYWEQRKSSDPELYLLATTVLGVPMTQVSVERVFSQLRQVLSILRYSLSSDLVNDILFLRCNAFFGLIESR